GEIRIGNEVSSLPAGTPYRLPFGWIKENGPRAIVLGSGLQELGDYALYNNVWDCDLIVDCYALNPPVMNGANVFNWSRIQNGSQCVATLNVVNDAAVEAAYRADTYWKKFSISSWLTPADAPTECTVTFVDWDGTVLQQTTTRPGMMVTPPADPVRPGYTFRGWDSQDYNWVVSDLTITALYYDDTFTVRFYDWDGTVLSEQTVNYGQAASAPADPSREGYTFLGWSEDFSDVTADKYIVAMYHNDHEGIEDIQTDKVPNIKVMIDGVIYILRDGKIYNLLGTQVR
ncbi:MAG: InlB B-repeat-containing protein, partial [Prevotella sp.]|nr:InlB B-repeat-containing protein [Prevotella sp.]